MTPLLDRGPNHRQIATRMYSAVTLTFDSPTKGHEFDPSQ